MSNRIHNRHSIRLKEFDYSQSGAYFVTLVRQDRKYSFGKIESDEMILSLSGRIIGNCWLWLAQQYPYVELDEYVVMPDHFHGILIINRDFDSFMEKSESPCTGEMRPAPCASKSESPCTGEMRPAPCAGKSESPCTGEMRPAPCAGKSESPCAGEMRPAPCAGKSESAPCTGGSRSAPPIKIKPLGQLIGAFKTISTKQINLMQNTPGKILWQRNYYEHIIRNENDLDRIRKYIRSNLIYWNK
ncbi:MAG: hypothetical protein ABFD58_06600 [Anaerolineaceae bacterium]